MMKKVINYLLSNDLAEIPKRGRRELKSIIIDDKQIRYNKDKPISTVLTKKLLTVKKTNEYRSYALNKAKDAFSEGRVRQILTKHAIRNKFRVRDIQSAFRRYANSIVLENKHFEGERGLEMIAHQKPRLLEFLRNNRSMKLNITEAFFETPEYNDGGNEIGSQELVYALPSTRFNISNEDELTQALEGSVKQILLQIQNLEASTTNLATPKLAGEDDDLANSIFIAFWALNLDTQPYILWDALSSSGFSGLRLWRDLWMRTAAIILLAEILRPMPTWNA